MSSPVDDQELAHRLQRLVSRLNRRLQVQSAVSGTSAADAMLLAVLRHTPGLGVCELAALDNITRPVMSGRVKRLEAAGLIARDSVVRDDRRRFGLVITNAGRDVLKTITEQRGAWMVARLAGLSTEERKAVRRAVESLEVLTRDVAHSDQKS